MTSFENTAFVHAVRGPEAPPSTDPSLHPVLGATHPTHSAPAAEPPLANRRVRVTIIDDDAGFVRAWGRLFDPAVYDLTVHQTPLEVVEHLEKLQADVAVVDLRLPHLPGMEVVKRLRGVRPDIEVIVMTAHATVETALESMRLGVFDYLQKPFETLDAAVRSVDRAAERKRMADRSRLHAGGVMPGERYEELLGKSPRMHKVFQLVETVASSACNVLIQGESGTGKELVARAIHVRSPRRARPFVVINCGALTETLLESELFGHVRGAFTGAAVDKKGLFEVADGGTIFLDEIGELPASTQVKLLRVLQEGELKPVGSTQVVRVDVRTLAASNRDLESLKDEGLFREDLYYRLNVITIQIPPLRDRPEDVLLLAYHFLRKQAARAAANGARGKAPTRIAPEAMEALQAYGWPGNVRELENVIERACVLDAGDAVLLTDLPPALTARAAETKSSDAGLMSLPFKEAKEAATYNFEKRYLSALLARTRGNLSYASRAAGMDRSNFRRVVKKHDLEPESFRRR